ncbi:alpha/beta fold hydrolase [Rubripirellula amarantea]|nr:alpha/beta fold hydrolase [Rubripirellula amarantea]
MLVEVSQGDRIALHIDEPEFANVQTPTVLLVHGLTGCHAAPYMIRFAHYFLSLNYRVCRMDMRGFGAAWAHSQNLSHAGRSDDCLAALSTLAANTTGDLFAVGVSLGGNQLLRGIGRIGAGLDPQPSWMSRLSGVAAVCPPIDLKRCADNMDRRRMRLYNHYFIRALLRRPPKLVAQRADFQAIMRDRRPKTLRQLDEQFTAPLSGFDDALHYYRESSAIEQIGAIRTPTLIIASKDDPIVPYECFSQDTCALGNIARTDKLNILSPRAGGHVGFIGRDNRSWLESTIEMFFRTYLSFQTGSGSISSATGDP